MKSAMVQITGYIDVPPERCAEFELGLALHRKLSLADKGCERFEVKPSMNVPGRFEVDEIFTSHRDFEAHVKRVKTSKWWRMTNGLNRNYQIQIL